MAETNFRGPLFAMGGTEDNRSEIMDGPSLFYQGSGFPDVRVSPIRKDGLYQGRVPSFLNCPDIIVVDAIPGAVSTTGLAAAANAVSGTAMTLVTVSPGGAAGGGTSLASSLPMIPLNGSAPVLVTAPDFGYTTGTIVAASATVTVPDSTLFRVGQWICIGGGGNAAKTLPLITQVLTLATATTITVSIAPSASLTRAPIGSTNENGILSPTPPNAVYPFIHRGLGTFLNPAEAVARCASITSTDAAAVGGAFLVTSYDVFGQKMTETLTHAGAATTVFGQKAHKYVVSIVPQFSDAHAYSAGWGDTFGIHLRSDRYEHLDLSWGAKNPVISTGWLGADKTSPATATTGDVRGTLQVSANGRGSALAAPVAANSDGTLRLVMAVRLPPLEALYATVANSVPLFGVTQA